MKKIALLCIFSLMLMCSFTSTVCLAVNYENPVLTNDPDILQNITARILIKDIQKAINGYYSEYLASPPQIEVYAPKSTTKIINVDFEADNNLYIITLEVCPYIGAHNQIGRDRIVFESNVKMREFKHLKSFEIVPWLKDWSKKPFPPDTYS